MRRIGRILIVGAGLAGAKAAESLRAAGYDGTLTLIGEEPERPYMRPPLSKAYLRGEKGRDDFRVHPPAFYDEQRIQLVTGCRVEALDPALGEVRLATGQVLRYDRLLLATGARPRGLDIDGGQLPGVITLRTLADAERLRAAAAEASRIVVVGAGWIGSEVAASLRATGRTVTLLASGRAPLDRAVGPEVAAALAATHRDRGVDLREHARAVRLAGTDRVTAVELITGEQVAADLVVAATGVTPRSALARAAGLRVGDGVEVSERLESSAAGVFAIGDVAAAWHPVLGRRLRVEHLSNARLQGEAVGRLMLGEGRPFDAIPAFFSEQHGVRVEQVGLAPASATTIIRGSLVARSFVAIRCVDGRVVAGTGIDAGTGLRGLAELIRSGARVDPRVLADPDVPLEAVAAAPAA